MSVPAIGCIVEGEGDELAVPVLIRRIAANLDPPAYVDVFIGRRTPRSALLRDGGIRPQSKRRRAPAIRWPRCSSCWTPMTIARPRSAPNC